MKNKRNLIISILQIVIGVFAIAAFAVLRTGGENMTKWIITLALAVAYVVLGIVGVVEYRSKK